MTQICSIGQSPFATNKVSLGKRKTNKLKKAVLRAIKSIKSMTYESCIKGDSLLYYVEALKNQR